MAIKIDLLPGYVKLRRDLHRSIAGCIVATGVVVSGLLIVLQQRRLELETAQTNLAVVKDVATKATAAGASATAALGQAAPAEGAINFMAASLKTGPQRAALLDLVRQYIADSATVSSIDMSDGTKVVIKASVTDPDKYALFLNNLRRGADVNGGVLFKGLPTASGPGGFANGAVPFQFPVSPNGEPVPIVYPISVTAEGTLASPIQVPADPTTAAAAAPAGGPDAPPVPPPAT